MNMTSNYDKSSISLFLIEHASNQLKSATVSDIVVTIRNEVQISININLLIGLALEGIINEVGLIHIDKWTWTELEKQVHH